jgi:hypothetical protein
MDWFEKLTGFREAGYEESRGRFEVADGKLRSRVNGASYETGELELVSLRSLRKRAESGPKLPGRMTTSVVVGDVRRMHRLSKMPARCSRSHRNSILFEMVSPDCSAKTLATLSRNASRVS